MTPRSFSFASACLVAALLAGCAKPAPEAPAPKPAPDSSALRAEKGRAVLAAHGDSVVTVELVATVTVSVNERSVPPKEQKIEVNGTVLTSGGLTVTSLATIDLKSRFELAPGMAGNNKISFGETDFKEVKIKFADGAEVPAKVILKDADLDLAFIAPDPDKKPPTHTFNPLLLSDSVQGRILDLYFTLARAQKALQAVPEIIPQTIVGIVEKPRQYYIVTANNPGCPSVSEDGKLLGVCVEHSGTGTPVPVVLPAADIADLAQQAIGLLKKPEAQASAPAAAAPAPVTK